MNTLIERLKALTAWNARINEELLREARFLCDRLDDLEIMDDATGTEIGREYYGHVDPSHCRLKSILERLERQL